MFSFRHCNQPLAVKKPQNGTRDVQKDAQSRCAKQVDYLFYKVLFLFFKRRRPCKM